MIVDEDVSAVPWFKMATAEDMEVDGVSSTIPGINYKVVSMKLKTTTPYARLMNISISSRNTA